jgi:hypothetical protein
MFRGRSIALVTSPTAVGELQTLHRELILVTGDAGFAGDVLQAMDVARNRAFSTLGQPLVKEHGHGHEHKGDNRSREEVLAEALDKAREVFGIYAKLHQQKGSPAGMAKAETNASLAEMCSQALHYKEQTKIVTTPVEDL